MYGKVQKKGDFFLIGYTHRHFPKLIKSYLGPEKNNILLKSASLFFMNEFFSSSLNRRNSKQHTIIT